MGNTHIYAQFYIHFIRISMEIERGVFFNMIRVSEANIIPDRKALVIFLLQR